MTIIVCDDEGRPLQVSSTLSAYQAAAIDRSADLLMAHQWGREAVGKPEQERAFAAQYGDDPEARQHFEIGMKSTQSTRVWHHPKGHLIIDDPFGRSE